MAMLIVDSQQMYMDGVEQLLRRSGFEPPVTLQLCASPLRAPRQLAYDATVVGVCDRSLGQALELLDGLGSRTGRRVCILSDGCADLMGSVISAGFDAFVHRAVEPSQLLRAVNVALAGGRFVDETVGAWLLSVRQCPWTPFGLTVREQQIAEMLARGRSTCEIAAAIGVSSHTVKFHIRNVYRKTGVRSRLEIVALAHASVDPGSAAT